MSYLNTIVDKVYVINLDKDTERMKSIDKQFRAAGIRYTRVSAIDGSKVGRNPMITEHCHNYCTDGMKGCALSHRLIWDDMLEHGYSKVAIFEDDAMISKTFQNELKVAWPQLPKDFDMFYIGCLVKCGDPNPIPKIINAVQNDAPKEYDKNIMSVRGSIGTHGYIISKKCATIFQKLLINGHIDSEISGWISKFNLNAYSITPLIVKPTGVTASNISDGFPYILNTFLYHIPFGESITFDWSLSGNFMKIYGYNINILVVIFTIISFLTPFQYSYLLAIWLFIELLVSLDFRTAEKFTVFIGLGLGLRIFMNFVTKGNRLHRYFL